MRGRRWGYISYIMSHVYLNSTHETYRLNMNFFIHEKVLTCFKNAPIFQTVCPRLEACMLLEVSVCCSDSFSL